MLERINGPGDLKSLRYKELETLAGEIREYIINTTAVTGGHLASNLGVVELTMALFRVFDPPRDRIVWDVGHQAYTHKILSGRRDALKTIRQTGGLSGFPKTTESPFDAFDTGHSSTSISAALGIAQARDLKGEDYSVISVIGDGAMTGGMAFEGLNNASRMKKNFIVVLNDNNMSISKNVGGLSNYLNGIRTYKGYTTLKKNVETGLRNVPVVGDKLVTEVKRAKDSIKQMIVPGMMFEDMGITYLGPVDGHDIKALERALRQAKKLDHAVIVHVITKKGKGYGPAEENPENFHGVDSFNPETGERIKTSRGRSYSSCFSEALLELADDDSRIVAVTAAMPDGTGLKAFSEKYPERFFDVGIAEAHAVTSAAGMASNGLKPVVAIYSSFLQRGFDQLVHDVCLQNLPVVFAVDRAGLVGSDGETHQGIFDISFLSEIPNMTVMAPKNAAELKKMLKTAFSLSSPCAIRYPRGTAYEGLGEFDSDIVPGKSELLYKGNRVVLFALGSMVSTAEHVREKLKIDGINATLINARFAKPLDEEMIRTAAFEHELFVTLEENVLRGGMGIMAGCIAREANEHIRVLNIALPDSYIEHGDVDTLRKMLSIDSESILEKIRNCLNEG
ncbi:MAG: 1-deoxy-D-xylulose-5-phosphate synthase [Lachnospiraceae bacterium]|nr:1-deoxy-D-xylulose-5-phosphate synthase [Lachnospiraceae bacterium]